MATQAIFLMFVFVAGDVTEKMTAVPDEPILLSLWNYYPDMHHTTILKSEKLLNITVNITSMSLEDSNECKADSLTIWNSLSTTRLLGPVCGILPVTEPLTLNTVDYGVTVEFVSDYRDEYEGYFMNIIGVLPDETICDRLLNEDNQEITASFNEHFGKYPTKLNCSWILRTDLGMLFKLDFKEFDIEYSGPDCVYDYLEVWEFSSNDSGQLRGRFCGRHLPWTMTTSSNEVLIKFVSDSTDDTKWFRVSYATVNSNRSDGYTVAQTSEFYKISTLPLPTVGTRPNLPPVWKIRTYPGFIIKIHFYELMFVKLHDGPDPTFDRLQPDNSSNIMSSTGFYVTMFLDFDPEATTANVTFEAINDVTPQKTSILYKGEVDFRFTKTRGNAHFIYVAASVAEHKYPRVRIKEHVDLLQKSANIDDCAYTGIALYDGKVSCDTFIGSFCDIDDNFTNNVIERIVGSSSVFHAVLYNYANMYQNWKADWLEVAESHCPGYHLSDDVLLGRRTIHGKSFRLRTTVEAGVRHASVSFENWATQCALLYILNIHKESGPIRITFNGPIQYHLCQHRGLILYPSNISKYNSIARCTTIFVNSGRSKSEIIRPEMARWSKRIVWIEIGSFAENACNALPSNCSVQIYNWNCGILQVKEPTCSWWLFSSQNIKGHWDLKLRSLTKSDKYAEAELFILEYLFGQYVGITVSNLAIWELRLFRYKSQENVYMRLTVLRASQVDLSYEFVHGSPIEIPITSFDPEKRCTVFNNHCYKFEVLDSHTTWLAAANKCRDDGGYLISINTIEELDFVKYQLNYNWSTLFVNQIVFIGLQDRQKTGEYRWEDGTPLTISDWYYPFDPFHNVLVSYPVESWIDKDNIQPVQDLSQRCVAMLLGNAYFSSNWRKIACKSDVQPEAGSICEYNNASDITEEKISRSNIDTTNEVSELACKPTWNFVDGLCLAVLTTDAPLTTYVRAEVANKLCEDYGGRLAKVDKLSRQRLKDYLLSLSLGSFRGGFWVNLTSSKSGCISLPMLESQTLYKAQLKLESNTCLLQEGLSSHTICETDPFKLPKECQLYQFMCDDGTCLAPDLVCDLHNDCPSGEDESNCFLDINIFNCSNAQSISILKYCDFHENCEDKSDEMDCVRRNCSSDEYTCFNKECIPKSQRCDHKKDCIDGSDEESCDWGLECKSFRCPMVGCIPRSKVKDIHPDCPDKTGADEINANGPEMLTIYDHVNWTYQKANLPVNECPGRVDHQRCSTGHIKCYPRHKSCLYDQNSLGAMRYCRNGAHLKYCETFECPDMFKCRRSYCIPHHKVCDHVIDCAEGEDEHNCEEYVCPYKLRCGSRSTQCVSQDAVCDGQVHCKDGYSDERFCDIRNSSCPTGCTCIGYIIICRGLSLKNIPEIKPRSKIRVLDLGGNSLVIRNDSLLEFFYLTYFHVQQNGIRVLQPRTFLHAPNLLVLDLSDNQLDSIQAGTFDGLKNLKSLNLLGNPIKSLVSGSFSGLDTLHILNLTQMYIQTLEDNTFNGLKSLKSLDITDNQIDTIDPYAFSSIPRLDSLLLDKNPLESTGAETFQSLNVKALRTSSYRFCCYVGNDVAECEPSVDIFSSCADLLSSDFLQVVVWAFAVMTLVGNGCVIIWRLHVKLTNVPSVFVLNLSMSDFLMGVYLLSLSIADTLYRDTYILNDVEWRTSIYCQAIGVIATVSCEKSLFTLVCIAIDRTKRLAFPYNSNQLNKKSAWKIEIVGWVTCLLLGLFPLSVPSYFGNYYGRNAICLPFNFAEPRGNGWEFATAIFVGLNSFALILIFVMYSLIYWRVKDTQTKAGRLDRADLDVARKLSIVIITNVVCMIPIIIANISSVIGQPIDRELASLLTAVIMPLNSSLNPYLFTFSACRSHKQNKGSRVQLATQNPKTAKTFVSSQELRERY